MILQSSSETTGCPFFRSSVFSNSDTTQTNTTNRLYESWVKLDRYYGDVLKIILQQNCRYGSAHTTCRSAGKRLYGNVVYRNVLSSTLCRIPGIQRLSQKVEHSGSPG